MKNKKKLQQRGPFFSVVVPLYNKKSYILRSLKSILGQSFRGFEVIVIDDGSTDGGSKLVSSLKDKRIRLIAQKNAGVSSARNKGVSLAQGKYVTYLDADDEWSPDYLEALKKLISDFPDVGLYATNYRVHDGNGTSENLAMFTPGWRGRMKDFFNLVYGERTPFHISSVCLPMAVARQNPFPVGIKGGEDIYVWFQVCLKHEMAYLNRSYSTWYQETQENAHHRYFGPQYHLDWLSIAERLRRENALSESARKFTSWVALTQAKKMILHGYRKQAVIQWWRCPKKYFLSKQVLLLLLAFSPLMFYKAYQGVTR